MPKKHKSGGKKQPPKNRSNRSLQDTFSSAGSAFGTPQSGRNTNGNSPRPFFSLRDEVMNTERHHTPWNPSTRLRDHGISFVSAGTIAPLEEPELHDPTAAPQDDDDSDDQVHLTDSLDDLGAEDGALAQMNIHTDTNLADAEMDLAPQPTNEQDMQVQDVIIQESVNEQELHLPDVMIAEPIDEQEPAAEEEDSPSIFFVDTKGDDNLAFKGQKSAFPIRPASPTPSDSSEELVFHGRNNVVVRDDPPQSKKAEQKAATPVPLQQTTSSQPAFAEEPLDALMRAIDEQDTLAGPSTENWGPRYGDKEEPKHWGHADGSISHKQTVWPVAQPTPRLDDAFSAIKPASRKSKKARKKQNKIMRQELDPEDELLQDYIDNMDPEEREAFGIVGSDDSTDDLFNKLLDQDDVDESLNPNELHMDTSSGSDSWHTDNGEDEDDDDEEDEESDDLDDLDSSDLESELEYKEREQWEDEADLRQRQRDAMTDEEIALILSKQEEYGMGGDDLLLFDDSGLGVGDLSAARAGLDHISGTVKMGSRSRNKNGMRKGGKSGGRKSDSFPDASLMADVLEEDPYGGFDVMDFDRPSLKPKSKGRKAAGLLPEELGISDDELIADLQSAWANDRNKKASRKAEREELRSLGLLPTGNKNKGNKKGNKFKPDMSVRYEEGISMTQVRFELRDFLDSDEWSTKHFPPMAKQDRKVLHEIANHFNLKSKSVGSGKNRAPVLIKTSRTLDFTEEHFTRVQGFVQRGFFRQTGKKGKTREFAADKMKKRGGGGGAAGLANGQVVGANAPEIGASNFGRKLMEKMGWQTGMALGKEGSTGLLVPVEARIKSGKGGLG